MEKYVGDVFVITKNYSTMSFFILRAHVICINFLIEMTLPSAQLGVVAASTFVIRVYILEQN